MRKAIPLVTLAAATAAFLQADEEFVFEATNCPDCKFWTTDVAVSNGVAAISARTGASGYAPGVVYLFDSQTGALRSEILAEDGLDGDRFGHSVDLSAEALLVGAPSARPGGVTSGQAYLYDPATGAELFKLVGSDVGPGDEFGKSVAVDGRKVLVGAPNAAKTWKRTGAAYLFDRQTGNELASYYAEGGQQMAGFGSAVDLDETSGYAVIGAPFAYGGPFGVGAAYVFDVKTGDQLLELAADVPLECVNFGARVVVDGTRALITAPGYEQPGSGHGTVYLFDLTTGEQLHQWTTADGAWTEQFGFGLALEGDVALISEPYDSNLASHSGVVHAYHVPSGHKITELRPNVLVFGGLFGLSIELDGDTVVVGAVETETGKGGAYGFDLGLDPIGTGYCAASNNSTGSAGQLQVVGSDSTDDECVIVRADGLPAGTVGLFLNSQTSGSLYPPGSQGELCLGGGIGRYDIDLTGDDGGMSILLDLQDTPTPGGGVTIQPGETWHFQAWYLDHNPHQTSNFTDAIEVTFQ